LRLFEGLGERVSIDVGVAGVIEVVVEIFD
jgi:hypothetical protein